MEQPLGNPAPMYRERLWPSIGYYVAVLVFVAVVTIAVGAANENLGLILGAATLLLLLLGLWLVSAPVQVTAHELRAGPARIDPQWCGDVHILDAAGMKAALGPGSDARVFGLVRPWISGGVMITLTDPQDPTPAWLLSSRQPDQLAAALIAAKK